MLFVVDLNNSLLIFKIFVIIQFKNQDILLDLPTDLKQDFFIATLTHQHII